jgi:hypothetical protein
MGILILRIKLKYFTQMEVMIWFDVVQFNLYIRALRKIKLMSNMRGHSYISYMLPTLEKIFTYSRIKGGKASNGKNSSGMK